jgi:hypothetical protein
MKSFLLALSLWITTGSIAWAEEPTTLCYDHLAVDSAFPIARAVLGTSDAVVVHVPSNCLLVTGTDDRVRTLRRVLEALDERVLARRDRMRPVRRGPPR